MKKTKMILLEPVLSRTVYSIIRTTLLLLSLTLTAICMPYVLSWSKQHTLTWPAEIPLSWTKAFVQMETASISGAEPSVVTQWFSRVKQTASNPSNWLMMEGVFFDRSVAYANSNEAGIFPEPSESVPPTDWFFSGIEEDALEPSTELQESPAASVLMPNKVLLYFTHSRESYLPYLPETSDPNKTHHSKVNVTQMGPYIKTALEKRGVGAVVNDTDVVGKLKEQGLEYWAAYDVSREVVKEAMSATPEITYLVDVHRDSVRRDVTALEYEGKVYAKIALVVGGEHEQSDKNLALAKTVHEKLNKAIPGISRGVYVKEGAGTNGKFNQDLTSKALLMELGGVDNTFEEIQLSADVFADVLAGIILEAEAVGQP
ncbi:stage II sporulation protein P [Jeotgalibacillus proteolyticus]|nr:stage II sporulation protein P [Jeotgalibacillus proteolyticus]